MPPSAELLSLYSLAGYWNTGQKNQTGCIGRDYLISSIYFPEIDICKQKVKNGKGDQMITRQGVCIECKPTLPKFTTDKKAYHKARNKLLTSFHCTHAQCARIKPKEYLPFLHSQCLKQHNLRFNNSDHPLIP